MKKILSISLLLSVLFLYGCSTAPKEETKTMTANQIFEKKQECASYEKEIQEYIKDQYNYTVIDFKTTAYLEEIFYSPLKNTCAYKIHISNFSDSHNETRESVIDFFSKQIIWNKIESCRDKIDDELEYCAYFAESKYESDLAADKELKEIKGE